MKPVSTERWFHLERLELDRLSECNGLPHADDPGCELDVALLASGEGAAICSPNGRQVWVSDRVLRWAAKVIAMQRCNGVPDDIEIAAQAVIEKACQGNSNPWPKLRSQLSLNAMQIFAEKLNRTSKK